MGILYYRKAGSIVIKPRVGGKDIELLTPLWLIQEVISGKRKFGHFNSRLEWKKNKEVDNG